MFTYRSRGRGQTFYQDCDTLDEALRLALVDLTSHTVYSPECIETPTGTMFPSEIGDELEKRGWY